MRLPPAVFPRGSAGGFADFFSSQGAFGGHFRFRSELSATFVSEINTESEKP